MPKVEVAKGVELFVQDWGAGPPIVFVHGWPLSHRMFENQMLFLADRGFRAIGIDLRGFGESAKPWDGNDYDTWARDTGKVIEALDLRDVTLAGFSMGGAIAMHYASRNSPRVTRLALLAAAGPYMIAAPGNQHGVPRDAWNGFLQGEVADRAKLKRDFGESFFHNPVSPQLARWFEDIGMQASPRASLRGLEELRDRDLRSELAAIRVPTRIFHGVEDQIVPFALSGEQQRLIRGASVVRFENSGHGLFIDEKEKLNQELAKFASGEITRTAR
jgi:pimeloyl-ACP methyl ester carboxylesterase